MIRPACKGQHGVIVCDCFHTPRAMDCLRARYQWIRAESIARLRSNGERHAAIRQLEDTLGGSYAITVKQMAKELMAVPA